MNDVPSQYSYTLLLFLFLFTFLMMFLPYNITDDVRGWCLGIGIVLLFAGAYLFASKDPWIGQVTMVLGITLLVIPTFSKSFVGKNRGGLDDGMVVVDKGRMQLIDFETTCQFFSDCFTPNDTPYLTPIWDRYKPEPGERPGQFLLQAEDIDFRDEVIIVYGKKPIGMRYFSVTPYVYLMPECTDTLFASASDSLNAHYFAPVDRSFVVLYGSNLNLLETLRVEMEHEKVYDRVFVFPLAYRPGAHYTFIIRSNGFRSETDRKRWTEHPEIFLKRIKNNHFAGSALQETSIWLPRATEGDEHVNPGMHVLETYVAQIKELLMPYVESWHEVTMEPFVDNGDVCVNNCSPCQGDTRDALYRALFYPENSNSLYVAVSVNHNKYEKSTYTSLSVYDAESAALISTREIWDKQRDFNIVIASWEMKMEEDDVPHENMNPIFVRVPKETKVIYIVERIYLQVLGNALLAPDNATLLPVVGFHGTIK